MAVVTCLLLLLCIVEILPGVNFGLFHHVSRVVKIKQAKIKLAKI